MQTAVNFLFPFELFLFLGLIGGTFGLMAVMISKAAKKPVVRENAKKVAIGTAKVAGKAVGKVAAKVAWQAFKNRTGL